MSFAIQSLRHAPRVFRALAFTAASAALFAPWSAQAAGGQSDPSAYQQLQQEQSWCKSGQSGQDEAACLKSAGAAYQEAKAGRLDTAAHPYQDNQMARCDPLPPEDRADCEKLVSQEGSRLASTQSGVSVVVRRTVVTAPAPEPTETSSPN